MSAGRWEFDENGNVHYVENDQKTTDGSYHYSYRQSSNTEKAPPKRKKADDSWHWIFIVLGFMIWPPVGVVLLILQLMGKWPGNAQTSREFNRMTNAAKNAAGQVKQALTQSYTQAEVEKRKQSNIQPGNYGRTTAQAQEDLAREKARRAEWQQAQAEQYEQVRQTAKERKAEKARLKAERRAKQDEGLRYGLGHVRLFRWLGGIMAGVFGFSFVMELIDGISNFTGIGDLLSGAVTLLAFALIGVTLILMAGSRKKKLKKFQKYMSMIGDRETTPIGPLAGAMGVSEKAAEKDLEEMLERDFWPEGYVDAARQMLVLNGQLEVQEDQPVTDQEAVSEDDISAATLRHIRQVNDAIADPEMTAKISRIEELTAKIFKLLEEKPEKAGELRTFMRYYLPQTLKILERYSQLEAQGIEGENISEAKEKIEGMMDKLVDGYETQLDKLFADDVLDISADLKVMEQMMEKDGLAMDELKF